MQVPAAVKLAFPEKIAERAGRETLVIAGPARGATSALSYAWARAGYVLGEVRGESTHEDLEIRSLFGLLNQAMVDQVAPIKVPDGLRVNPGSAKKFDPDWGGFRALAGRRNARFERWGFKLPAATRMLPELSRELRNPVFLLVYRNPLRVAESRITRHAANGAGIERFLNGVAGTSAIYRRMASAVNKHQLPAILVDFDAIQQAPRPALESMFSALRFPVETAVIDGIAENLATPGYKTIAP